MHLILLETVANLEKRGQTGLKALFKCQQNFEIPS